MTLAVVVGVLLLVGAGIAFRVIAVPRLRDLASAREREGVVDVPSGASAIWIGVIGGLGFVVTMLTTQGSPVGVVIAFIIFVATMAAAVAAVIREGKASLSDARSHSQDSATVAHNAGPSAGCSRRRGPEHR